MRKLSTKYRKATSLLVAFALFTTAAFIAYASTEEEWVPLRASFEEAGAIVDWRSEDATIHIDFGLHDFIYHTHHPIVYVNGTAVSLQHGIILQESLSFITLSDLMLTMEVFEAGIQALRSTPNEAALVITTGLYGHGTPEQNAEVNGILGEDAEHEFATYFFWYNTIHEVGHAIVHFNSTEPLHMVDEEILVNDFAIAYWLHHGEEHKLGELQAIVTYALENFESPVPEGVSHIDYGREMIATGNPDFFTFNNYGWFQFNMVNDSLQRRRTLEDVLVEMGVENIQPQTQRTHIYTTLDEDAISLVIADAISEMREWGALLPYDVYLVFDSDPGEHNLRIISAATARRHFELSNLITILQADD